MKKKNNKNGWSTLGGIGAILAVFGSKLKLLIPLLKFGKIGGTIWSMGLMIGTYALLYPWTFAVGIAVMLLIHEMGHVYAAKMRGLPVTAPAFIPFMGALIMMKKQPADAETEAFVAYGGPLVGSIGALLTLGLGWVTNYEPLFAIAQIGFFLNLINLIPIHPLDGGRIVTAISRWLWIVGLVGGFFVIIYFKAFLFLIFWALFAWELFNKYVRKKDNRMIPDETQAFVGVIAEVVVDRKLFTESGVIEPREQHRRELSYVQFCRIRDKRQWTSLYYPGIGHLTEFPFERGLIQRVNLIGTQWSADQGRMRLEITYLPDPDAAPPAQNIQDEPYYKVSVGTRIGYGIAYFGLAAALGWLMYITNTIAPYPGLTG